MPNAAARASTLITVVRSPIHVPRRKASRTPPIVAAVWSSPMAIHNTTPAIPLGANCSRTRSQRASRCQPGDDAPGFPSAAARWSPLGRSDVGPTRCMHGQPDAHPNGGRGAWPGGHGGLVALVTRLVRRGVVAIGAPRSALPGGVPGRSGRRLRLSSRLPARRPSCTGTGARLLPLR